MSLIRIGHTPDADDAFMFYGISSGKVKMDGYSLQHVVEDIESLNRKAFDEVLEVTAISAHAYSYLADKYFILSTGASMGMGYGPIVVTKKMQSIDELRGKTIAIPGKYTTAALLLDMAVKDIKTVEANFDSIPDLVLGGKVDGGILIHEGQLTYQSLGLAKVLDLGEWWDKESHGLPLPLGLDTSRKDLGEEFAKSFNEVFRKSVQERYANKDNALKYAMEFARGQDAELVDKFVSMYVNELTLDMGTKGKDALKLLYQKASQDGLIPETDPIII